MGLILVVAIFRASNIDFNALPCDFDIEEDLVEGVILEQFLRDQSLVDIDRGLVEVDKSHEEFHNFFDIEPILLVFLS